MRLHAIIAIAACLSMAACATPPMGVQQPTLANVQLLRANDMPPMAVGAFELAEGLPAGMARSVTIRASSVRAPGDGSFPHYLRQTLETELTAAGKLDPNAATAISGYLTRSEVSSNPSQGHGELGARFIVTRNGRGIYDKEHVVNGEWPSSFIGAIAIPEAQSRYTALYPALVSALLNDPAFRAAVRGE